MPTVLQQRFNFGPHYLPIPDPNTGRLFTPRFGIEEPSRFRPVVFDRHQYEKLTSPHPAGKRKPVQLNLPLKDAATSHRAERLEDFFDHVVHERRFKLGYLIALPNGQIRCIRSSGTSKPLSNVRLTRDTTRAQHGSGYRLAVKDESTPKGWRTISVNEKSALSLFL